MVTELGTGGYAGGIYTGELLGGEREGVRRGWYIVSLVSVCKGVRYVTAFPNPNPCLVCCGVTSFQGSSIVPPQSSGSWDIVVNIVL